MGMWIIHTQLNDVKSLDPVSRGRTFDAQSPLIVAENGQEFAYYFQHPVSDWSGHEKMQAMSLYSPEAIVKLASEKKQLCVRAGLFPDEPCKDCKNIAKGKAGGIVVISKRLGLLGLDNLDE